MSQEELSKVALGVPNSAMLGEPFLMLAGTSLTPQNQIYGVDRNIRSRAISLDVIGSAYLDTRIIHEGSVEATASGIETL